MSLGLLALILLILIAVACGSGVDMEDVVRQQTDQINEIVQIILALEAANRELQRKNDELTVAMAVRQDPPRQASYVDTRLLNKPNTYDGKLEDWPTWSFDVRTYLSAVTPDMLDLMRRREVSDGELQNLSPDDVAMNGQLYYVLVSLTKGDAKQKIKKVVQGSGTAAWAELLKWYEPKEQQRYASMLVAILQFPLVAPILQSLDAFDELVTAYERQTQDTIDDFIKVGVVLGNTRDTEVQKHLMMNASKLKS